MGNPDFLLTSYEERLAAVQKEIASLPEGRLVKKKQFYYQQIGTREVAITKKNSIIRQLCRKKFLLMREKEIKRNIFLLKRPISKLENKSLNDILPTLPPTYQEVPADYFLHSSVGDFLARTIPGDLQLGGERPYITKLGTRVRSKSEFMIATLLEELEVPYRYELPLMLGSQIKFPDFTIKNPHTGETIIWEHFGALNQPGYGEKMNEKMSFYLGHGFVPFKNLIYTFEFDVQNQARLRQLTESIAI